ncbi:MAG: YigZ family protein [Erysipelotrichia bacterium]|nr:YigZ family protein [Erysipelotrichia bacterium]NCC54469.1 YigZ family protein [Erysipelotrichia bacterium]
MYRIKEECTHTLEIEKSKFITYLKRVFSEAEAKAYIHSIQKLHPNATHHCYAFIIGEHDEIQRSNDNGEPSGTAGVPMLESLKKNHMQDIIAITVRYFGGIKLGAGGLIRAYSKSVSQALNHAVLTRKVKMKQYQLHFPYDMIGKLEHYFNEQQITIIDKIYDIDVCFIYQSNQEIDKAIAEISSGRFLPEFIKDEIVEEVVTLTNEN